MSACAFNNRHFGAHLFGARDGRFDRQTSGLRMSQDFSTKGKEILHGFSSFGREETLKEGIVGSVIGERFVCSKSETRYSKSDLGFQRSSQ